jgi:L-aspartate oxidase
MDEGSAFRSDILIIGCGIAGASAALEAAQRGLRVNIITKAPRLEESNTYYAQGGIVSLGSGDDPEILRDDIIGAGDGINNPEAVNVLAAHSRELVQKILINELGIPFTRSSPEALDYAQEAGHSRRRILHVKDTTGRTIEERFVEALTGYDNVTFFPDHTAVDLLTVPHHSRNLMAYYREPQCLGAYVLDNQTRAVRTFCASSTVLATGGCGAVYLFTSNPPGAIGGGYAMAHRAGGSSTWSTSSSTPRLSTTATPTAS